MWCLSQQKCIFVFHWISFINSTRKFPNISLFNLSQIKILEIHASLARYYHHTCDICLKYTHRQKIKVEFFSSVTFWHVKNNKCQTLLLSSTTIPVCFLLELFREQYYQQIKIFFKKFDGFKNFFCHIFPKINNFYRKNIYIAIVWHWQYYCFQLHLKKESIAI